MPPIKAKPRRRDALLLAERLGKVCALALIFTVALGPALLADWFDAGWLGQFAALVASMKGLEVCAYWGRQPWPTQEPPWRTGGT